MHRFTQHSNWISIIGLLMFLQLLWPQQLQAQPDVDDNPIEFEAFQSKALENVRRLGLYIKIISDKSEARPKKNRASEQALLLFVSDTTTVEVSSLSRSTTSLIFIREYLRRMRSLKYDQVSIDWVEIGYASDFVKAPDGNYYATVSVMQRFTGYMEGEPVYEDITEKEVQVILQPFRIVEEDVEKFGWDLLLGNISVTETRSA